MGELSASTTLVCREIPTPLLSRRSVCSSRVAYSTPNIDSVIPTAVLLSVSDNCCLLVAANKSPSERLALRTELRENTEDGGGGGAIEGRTDLLDSIDEILSLPDFR